MLNIFIIWQHFFYREIESEETNRRTRDHLYEVSATTTLPELTAPEVFSCELRIPQANYTVRRETVFYPGKFPLSGSLTFISRFTRITSCLKLYFIFAKSLLHTEVLCFIQKFDQISFTARIHANPTCSPLKQHK